MPISIKTPRALPQHARTRVHAGAVLTLGAVLAGCAAGATAGDGAAVVQPGAPGETSRVVAGGAPMAARAPHVAADVAFMQGMIAHHLQAIEMTALVAGRTQRQEIERLARRIEASQDDELELMRRWLAERDEAVPDEHAHHAHHAGGAPMPGMLSAQEIARLAAASGAEFDRLFLESMIRHHEGALVMVAELFAVEGAGQEPELFQFASHVDSDQRIEIARMQRMLAALR